MESRSIVLGRVIGRNEKFGDPSRALVFNRCSAKLWKLSRIFFIIITLEEFYNTFQNIKFKYI